MIILGIDPGTATTGYALIKKLKNNGFEIVDFGVISTKKTRTDSERLLEVQKDLVKIIAKYKPEVAGVEKLYFENNAKTAMTVSQARGVVLLTLQQKKIKLVEFTPLQVKSIICGYGKAEKKQVQLMVQKTFNLKTLPKPDDAADALAIALCAGFKKI
ncbi:MAG: crossover junction endodeoxyribonuclease RuvC [Candidatus Doudnabacteria bacterium]